MFKGFKFKIGKYEKRELCLFGWKYDNDSFQGKYFNWLIILYPCSPYLRGSILRISSSDWITIIGTIVCVVILILGVN